MRDGTPITIYRTMRVENDGHPKLGASLSTLGARPIKDIPVDDAGIVQPKTGGMSVTPDYWEDMPPALLPRNLGGESRHTLFQLDTITLPVELCARIDRPKHANVEPHEECLFINYNDSLQRTRKDWIEQWQ